MSSPKLPVRLREYNSSVTNYPRELTEVDGKLYITHDDGTVTLLNPVQTSVSGNAGSANKVNNNLVVKLNGGSTEGTDLFTFNGSAGKTINITPAGIGAATSSHGTHVIYATTDPKAAGTASAGTAANVSRGDHVHPLQTSVSGNAGTATKLANAVTIGLSGVTATAQEFDGSDDITIPITAVPVSLVSGLATVATSGSYNDLKDTPAATTLASLGVTATKDELNLLDGATVTTEEINYLDGVTSSIQTQLNSKAASSHGTHVSYGTAAPNAAGTASAGTATTVSRSDHVHPLQTSVSGNAGTATKLAAGVNIGLSGAVTATAQSFDGSNAITIPVTTLDGSKITGVIPLSSIPKGAQERLYPVADDTARLALTSSDVQNGDVITVENTGIMYYVVDETALGTEDAFRVFTAGAASSVAWTGITGKPTFATVATSGKYSDLSDTPTIPSASSTAPLAAGTAAAGTGTTWARADHVHPAQTTVSGNAGTATKLANAVTIGLSGVTATAQEFDGSDDITIPITAVPASIVTGLATVATSGSYNDLKDTPAATTLASLGVTATATELNLLDGVTVTTEVINYLDGVTGSIQTQLNNKAASSHGTHVTYATTAPNAAGTASAGSASTVSRSDHVHPLQTSVSGNAGTATKLANAVNISLSGVTATAQEFDGSEDVVIPVTAVPASIVTGLATVATSGKYSDLSDTPTIPSASSTAPLAAGTAAAGTGTTWARADHVHPAQTTITGNAGSATKVNNNLVVKLNSGATEGTDLFTFNGSAAKTINITPAGIGAAAASHGTHVSYGTTAPLVAGTAAVGTATTVSRSDHVHPAQTTITGNAGSATKVNKNLVVKLNGGSTEDTDLFTFNGSTAKTINITPAGIGAAAASHGTHVTYGTTAAALAASAAAGTASTVSRSDHVHPLPTLSALGAAASSHTHNYAGSASAGGAANSVANSIVVKLNSGTTEGTNLFTFNGSAGKTINITPSAIGAAASSHGTHVSFSTTAPAALGTAAVGSATTVSRSDHVHPLPTLSALGAAASSHTHTKSQITDFPTSMPASDVYSWAKASSKPSYSWSEITSKPTSFTPTSHNHTLLAGWADNRNVNTTPNTYNSVFSVSGLKTNTAIGITNGDLYSGVVGFRSWSDSSGGNSHEIAFAGNGKLFRRHGATTTWGSWIEFIDSSNIGSQSVNYATSAGSASSATSATKATQDASGNTITSTYATKSEVQTAINSFASALTTGAW